MILSKYFSSFILILFLFYTGFSQNHSVDVQHYKFNLTLSDSTDQIIGKTDISFVLLDKTPQISFDLIGQNTDKGMQVTKVESHHKELGFEQKEDKVFIDFDKPVTEGERQEISIYYQGIPADGLIIDKNKFGERTFFTDNWPERARHWIPTNDHPSDKASVEFIVTAPDHYQVVGNGVKVESTDLLNGNRLTHWKMDRQVPTKVMAIGVADFAVRQDTIINAIPIENWVFTENKDQGLAQYKYTEYILPFFENYIADFPYKKLANVQSKTRFGGMENASNIFYYESSVKTDTPVSKEDRIKLEALMAHETAHQWFGNSLSETDWEHLWLSEGFSTYMTDLYLEDRYGKAFMQKRMGEERRQVIEFYKKSQHPVVDTLVKHDLMSLLNPNSYQKGAWVLHMLRQKMGDENFQKVIRKFYDTYKSKNASTKDFQKIVEAETGEYLDTFFQQWLYRPGHPQLAITWHYDKKNKNVELTVEQLQDKKFKFPLEIEFSNHKSNTTKSIEVDTEHKTYAIPVEFIPDRIKLDPLVKLLFEAKTVSHL